MRLSIEKSRWDTWSTKLINMSAQATMFVMYSVDSGALPKMAQISSLTIYFSISLRSVRCEARLRKKAVHAQPVNHNFHIKILKFKTNL